MALSKLLDSKSSATPAGNSSQTSSHRSSAMHASTTIAEGVKIAGVLSIQGDADIDGELEGELHCFGTLTLSKKARVHGSICAHTVRIAGSVYGDILAEKKIILEAPAQVEGSLSAPAVVIEDGVHFEGECIMKGSPITTKQQSDHKTNLDTSEQSSSVSKQNPVVQKRSLENGEE